MTPPTKSRRALQIADIKKGFVGAGLTARVVDEVLEAYSEAKRRYYLGDHRPQAVEGGRFSEGVFRLLQHETGQNVTPLGKTLPSVDTLLERCAQATGAHDSVRLHIPRTLKLIYDIRNKRDTAHLGDGIDPNRQDATLVTNNMDWVMAELVRLYHGVEANEAQTIIENLVSKEVPAVQEINGQPVILADLKPQDQVLLMLYRAGANGAVLDDLATQLRASRKDHLSTRLGKLDDRKLVLLHPSGRYYITGLGIRYVEERRLLQPVG
jgi:hypothetical protein